jgi:hypothetical protein
MVISGPSRIGKSRAAKEGGDRDVPHARRCGASGARDVDVRTVGKNEDAKAASFNQNPKLSTNSRQLNEM